jgi:hypothetical protein
MPRVESLLSTLNAADVGSLESIAGKLLQVRDELLALDQPELAQKAEAVLDCLRKGDVAEFKRGRAFLQSKIGHLRT